MYTSIFYDKNTFFSQLRTLETNIQPVFWNTDNILVEMNLLQIFGPHRRWWDNVSRILIPVFSATGQILRLRYEKVTSPEICWKVGWGVEIRYSINWVSHA